MCLFFSRASLAVIVQRLGEEGQNFKEDCLLLYIKQASNLSALIHFLHAHNALGLPELSWAVRSHLPL